MNKWKITFWTPGNRPADDGMTFGCAVHGFCSADQWVEPADRREASWGIRPEGMVLSGSYAEVLEKLSDICFKPKAAIAVFSKPLGVENFLREYKRILGAMPVVGGGAAIGEGKTRGEILPDAEEVSLLLICQEGFSIETQNIHVETDKIVYIEPETERLIKRIRGSGESSWHKAMTLYRRLQDSEGIAEDNFELLTFSDKYGRNIHCSASDEGLKTGSNLPQDNTLHVRVTTSKQATQKIGAFISSEDSLVFGCAGLRSLLDEEMVSGKGTLAGFMFGELVYIEEEPMFGNLMMTRIYLNQ